MCRFRNRGVEYVSGCGIVDHSGLKWMSGGAKLQCDRALGQRDRARLIMKRTALAPAGAPDSVTAPAETPATGVACQAPSAPSTSKPSLESG